MKGYDLRAPVVLLHGLFGFERIGLGPLTFASYFRGLPDHLRRRGVRVLAPRVHPTACPERRARKLAERLDAALPADEPFHLIGHSLGGLDARALLLGDRWRGRVLSLTTVATPHLGSPLAEAARRRLGPVYRMLEAVGWDHRGFLAIEPDAARRWHDDHPAPEDVPCYSVAGDPPAHEVCWPLRVLHSALAVAEGDNDGLVSARSALAFGTPLPTVPVDHLRQMNWCTGTPRRTLWPRTRRLYAGILDTIAAHDPAAVELAGAGA